MNVFLSIPELICELILGISLNTLLSTLSSTKLPESYGSRSSYIERIDAVRHRNTDYVVSFGNRFRRKSVPFGTHHDSQSGFGCQDRIINGNRVIRECHGSCTEAQLAQVAERTVHPSPWYKEDRSHRYSDCTTVQRVTRVTRQ